jgi:DNA-binding transcriptional MerR regulator
MAREYMFRGWGTDESGHSLDSDAAEDLKHECMLRIGDFARLAGVTVRALRHYEERGLLRPALVDATTGYRFYRAEQLALLDRVLALRDPSAVEEALSRHRQRVADEVHRQAARLRRLLALQGGVAGGARDFAIRVRPLPPVRALTIRARVPSLGAPVTALFEKAEAVAARDRIDRSPFLLFHRPLEVEVCIPVRGACKLRGAREIEGAPLASSLIFLGGYQQTEELRARMTAWLGASGLRPCGPLREVYHRFGADQRGYRLPPHRLAALPAHFVTELQLPAEEVEG